MPCYCIVQTLCASYEIPTTFPSRRKHWHLPDKDSRSFFAHTLHGHTKCHTCSETAICKLAYPLYKRLYVCVCVEVEVEVVAVLEARDRWSAGVESSKMFTDKENMGKRLCSNKWLLLVCKGICNEVGIVQGSWTPFDWENLMEDQSIWIDADIFFLLVIQCPGSALNGPVRTSTESQF